MFLSKINVVNSFFAIQLRGNGYYGGGVIRACEWLGV